MQNDIFTDNYFFNCSKRLPASETPWKPLLYSHLSDIYKWLSYCGWDNLAQTQHFQKLCLSWIAMPTRLEVGEFQGLVSFHRKFENRKRWWCKIFATLAKMELYHALWYWNWRKVSVSGWDLGHGMSERWEKRSCENDCGALPSRILFMAN